MACAVVCVRETKTFLCAAHTMYEVQLELKEAAYQLQQCRYCTPRLLGRQRCA